MHKPTSLTTRTFRADRHGLLTMRHKLGKTCAHCTQLQVHFFQVARGLSSYTWTNPTNFIAAACGKFHAVILQEASDHVPQISDQFIHTLATRTSLSCSTRTPSSPTLWFSPSRKLHPARTRGVWSYSSFEAFCDALRFLEHRQLYFALCTSTM